MKHITNLARLFACGLALFVLTGYANAENRQGKATVRAVRGHAQFSVGGGAWEPLKVGVTLKPGASIQTGPESTVDLFLGQNGPVIRVTPDTTVGLDKLAFTDTGADTVIDTQLNLKSGRILGNVKKLAAASKYEIKTPNGVAGIRGTDFDVTVTPIGGGKYDIVVTSITGTIVGAVVLDGTPFTAVINTGETWHPIRPGDQPQPLDPNLLLQLRTTIAELVKIGGGTGVIEIPGNGAVPIIVHLSPLPTASDAGANAQ